VIRHRWCTVYHHSKIRRCVDDFDGCCEDWHLSGVHCNSCCCVGLKHSVEWNNNCCCVALKQSIEWNNNCCYVGFPKKEPADLRKLYPSASAKAVRLIGRMLKMEPGSRISAVDALNDAYLSRYHDPDDEPACVPGFDFSFEKQVWLHYRSAIEIYNIKPRKDIQCWGNVADLCQCHLRAFFTSCLAHFVVDCW